MLFRSSIPRLLLSRLPPFHRLPLCLPLLLLLINGFPRLNAIFITEPSIALAVWAAEEEYGELKYEEAHGEARCGAPSEFGENRRSDCGTYNLADEYLEVLELAKE